VMRTKQIERSLDPHPAVGFSVSREVEAC
jgi:hypothetical protein